MSSEFMPMALDSLADSRARGLPAVVRAPALRRKSWRSWAFR